MKPSWIFFLLLLAFVAVFSVQNAAPIDVRLLAWEFSISSAIIIQLSALIGGLIGLAFGLHARATATQTAPEGRAVSAFASTPIASEPTPESP